MLWKHRCGGPAPTTFAPQLLPYLRRCTGLAQQSLPWWPSHAPGLWQPRLELQTVKKGLVRDTFLIDKFYK